MMLESFNQWPNAIVIDGQYGGRIGIRRWHAGYHWVFGIANQGIMFGGDGTVVKGDFSLDNIRLQDNDIVNLRNAFRLEHPYISAEPGHFTQISISVNPQPEFMFHVMSESFHDGRLLHRHTLNVTINRENMTALQGYLESEIEFYYGSEPESRNTS